METITKHTIWAITILLIVAMLCGTLIYLSQNTWTMRFEMDDNTKDAIKSIDFESIHETVQTPQPVIEYIIEVDE